MATREAPTAEASAIPGAELSVAAAGELLQQRGASLACLVLEAEYELFDAQVADGLWLEQRGERAQVRP